MEVSPNHLLLQMESNSLRLSCIRFWNIYNSLELARSVQAQVKSTMKGKKKKSPFFPVRQQKVPTYHLLTRQGNKLLSSRRETLHQFWVFLCFYRSFILVKDLVVLRHGHTEDDGCHVLETVDPFFPLWSLASHVEQLEVEVFEWEVNLHNARSLDPGPEDVLLGRLVVLGSQSVQIVKETEKEKFWYFSYRPETRDCGMYSS